MSLFEGMKEGWENIWLPRIQEGKTKIELERDRRYEAKWVWYHTIPVSYTHLRAHET